MSSGELSLNEPAPWSPVRFWRYVFPYLDTRTDRLIRRLIITDLAFLARATAASRESIAVFSAVLAGNVVGAIVGLLL